MDTWYLLADAKPDRPSLPRRDSPGSNGHLFGFERKGCILLAQRMRQAVLVPMYPPDRLSPAVTHQ